jgi:hypothetical protein
MVKGMRDEHIKKRLERQIEGLHSNEALTSDLDDDSAKLFLNWAEGRIKEIVGRTAELDDESAEVDMYPKLKAVRRMARYINRVARGQGENDELIDKIMNQARYIYGTNFQEPDSQKLAKLRMVSRSEPALFIHTIRQIFEGDLDGPEEANQ